MTGLPPPGADFPDAAADAATAKTRAVIRCTNVVVPGDVMKDGGQREH